MLPTIGDASFAIDALHFVQHILRPCFNIGRVGNIFSLPTILRELMSGINRMPDLQGYKKSVKNLKDCHHEGTENTKFYFFVFSVPSW